MMELTQENRLLVTGIQAQISESAQKQLQDLLKLPIHWDEFLAAATWHSVTPLIYANLKDIPEGRCVPPQIMQRLKAAYYATLARNMLLYSELDKVLESFLHAGIEVILLKGSALAKTVYADIAMRPMGDIDIMVRREELAKAEERLSTLGYVIHGKNPPEWLKQNHYHVGYILPERSVKIEIHWHITRKIDMERIHDPDSGLPEALWKRAYHRGPFMDNVRVLSHEDALHYLCIHFLKHRFPLAHNRIFTGRGALRQIADITHFLKQYEDEIDWKALTPGEGLEGTDGLIAFVVLLMRKIMGDNITAGGIEDCYELGGTDQAVLELMAKKIFIREGPRADAVSFAIDALSEVTFRGKARKVFEAVFPAPEIISKKYAVPASSKRLYFYYLRRPFDLFLKHKGTIAEVPRMKDDVMLHRWIDSRTSPFPFKNLK